MTTTRLWRVDTKTWASLVQAQDLPEALEFATRGRTIWGPLPLKGTYKDWLDKMTFDNIVRIEEVSSGNTTEGL